uniref:Uncharacterized protein n=2 Tax=Globisporangium ultimum (strain ATCC 200006 / CBS 805.95 / DAOM BR144) TaxID=431595 RepID=K3XCN3_GLOUD
MERELTRPGRQHQRLLVDATVPEARDPVPSNDAAESNIGAMAPSISHLRPDIQLYDNKTMEAVIIDLAVAFEDQSTDDAASSSSFARVKGVKTKKYEVIKQFLEYKGYTVHVAALVYGSLGSVDTGNFAVYTERLGLRKGAVRRLECSLSARHINFAHRMWRRHAIAHTTGLRLIGTNSVQQQ